MVSTDVAMDIVSLDLGAVIDAPSNADARDCAALADTGPVDAGTPGVPWCSLPTTTASMVTGAVLPGFGIRRYASVPEARVPVPRRPGISSSPLRSR